MNNLPTLISPQPAHGFAGVQQRLVIYPNELYRIPSHYDRLRVVAGTAFITQAGRDLVIDANHEVALSTTADVALVSPLRSSAVIIELLSRRPCTA